MNLLCAAWLLLVALGAEPPAAPIDPIQAEYERLIELDEAALNEVEKIGRDAEAFAAQGTPTPRSVLEARIRERLDPVLKGYESFLQKHPRHVEAFLAFGSFLNEVGETEEAVAQWEKAREIDPRNPAAWNNLANVFGHDGPIKKALVFFERAIELDPKEPVYLHNLAIMTFLYRKDVRQVYRLTEDQVFDKSLELYQRAIRLDPTNFVLAADYAQSYYGIKPPRPEAAVRAWNDALKLAPTPSDQEGVYLHLARVQILSGQFEEASRQLDRVQQAEHDEVKTRLRRLLAQKRSGATDPSADETIPGAAPAKLR